MSRRPSPRRLKQNTASISAAPGKSAIHHSPDWMPDPFDLVYVGELRPAKGIGTLIDAVALLRRESSGGSPC